MTSRRSATLAGLLVLVLLTALLPGCILRRRHVGRPLPDDGALQAALVIGTSTKAQALHLLGAPHAVRRQFDGDLLLWQRLFEQSESLVLIPLITFYLETEGSSRSDRLALLFDHAGVLSGVGLERDILSGR